MFAFFNLGLLSIEIILIVSWLIHPTDALVTIIVIVGIILASMESFRRFMKKSKTSNEQ